MFGNTDQEPRKNQDVFERKRNLRIEHPKAKSK